MRCPPTLYKLATLHKRFPETFQEWLEQGRITPSLQRNEISKVLRLERVGAMTTSACLLGDSARGLPK